MQQVFRGVYNGSASPMSAENPQFQHYQALVQAAEKHSLLACQGELGIDDTVVELVQSALDALAAGVSREEITRALQEGEERGVTLYFNLRQINDRDYWRTVRQEAERHWEHRYNPNASEDG